MSRHDLNAVHPRDRVTVGWDPPLRTYFAMAFREPPAGSDDEDEQLLWRGFGAAMGDEILDIDQLMVLVEPYVTDFPTAVYKQLILDRARNQ